MLVEEVALLCALSLAGCAASIPSVSSGTSTPSFGAHGDLPKRVEVRSGGIPNHDPVGDVLRAELPGLGFTLVATNGEASFDARVEYSDYSPIQLALSLVDAETGRTLWRAHVTREWDVYASVVSASESNAKKAMALLRRDLAAATKRR